ncbi:MAG: hypothetical protein OXH69_24130 [Acidobacteria bacterium]|nr:hypothetical protein [Acidobacteriota bacterium]
MPGRGLALALLAAASWIGEPAGRQNAARQDAPPPVEAGAAADADAAAEAGAAGATGADRSEADSQEPAPPDAAPQDAAPQDAVEGDEAPGDTAAADDAAAEGADAEDAPPEPPPEVLEIGDGLYVLPYCGNATLRVTAHGVVLVGDELAGYGAEIARLAATVTDHRIAYEIHTHRHGAEDDDAAAPGARRLGPALGDASVRAPAEPPDIVFTSGLSLFLGEAEIRLRHVGGAHSAADAVVAFPDRGAVHAGHLVTDGPPTIDYAGGGSAGGWIQALDALLALEFDTLIPGAGPVLEKSGAQAFRDRLVTLRTRIEQLVRRGVAKEEAARRLETTDLGWPLDPDGDFVRETLPGLYDEVAGGP